MFWGSVPGEGADEISMRFILSADRKTIHHLRITATNLEASSGNSSVRLSQVSFSTEATEEVNFPGTVGHLTLGKCDIFDLTFEDEETAHARLVFGLEQPSISSLSGFTVILPEVTIPLEAVDASAVAKKTETDPAIVEPTPEPTSQPTKKPTPEPTKKPTSEPTKQPTPEPTKKPTSEPTKKPTSEPTKQPTPEPTKQPTPKPLRQSDWSTDLPPAGAVDVQQKTQYSYADKETTTSTSSSLSGWTFSGQTSTQEGTPSSWSTTAATSSSTQRVETRVVYRLYYYPCSDCGYHNAFYYDKDHTNKCGGCKGTNVPKGNQKKNWQTTPYSQLSSSAYGGGKRKTSDGWYFNASDMNKGPDSGCDYIKRQYRTIPIETVYHYYRWSDYSPWSDTPVSETSTRKVKTRTLYRYKY